MKVDIWSDIRCPFCYIGKRKFEAALNQFTEKESVEIEWHSFELDPDVVTDPHKNVYEYLAERKGASLEWSKKMHAQVTRTAQDVGLNYNFENAVVANSYDSHRLIQLAKTKGLGDEAEEALFKAYFTDGVNIADHAALKKIGLAIGLEAAAIDEVLSTDAFAREVKIDGLTAQSIGVGGVPFFVIDERYAVSGAQPSEVFLEALQKSWKEAQQENTATVDAEGNICTPGGDCI